ncbi:MAG: ABC transporter permease [Tannerellaceae bacterium]|jgi:ABC-2 type transport system permease protein|nr:ABC transporter permease [Tannerellaceae bacterium]
MSKIGIVIKREYLNRVSKKSFIILTLLTPFLMVALVLVPLWLASIKGSDVRNIAIIDATGKYAPLFEDTDNYRFMQGDKSLEDYRIDFGEIYAVLNITDDLLANPKAATLYSDKQVPGELSRLINQTIRPRLENDKLATFDIPNLKEIIEESKVSFEVQTIKWGTDGTEQVSSAQVASIVGMIFTFIVYMFVMIYGAMVMSSVVEEKTSRIVEVMVSSVKPFDLMMGKIIGIGMVGLTQIFLWGILTMVLFMVGGIFFGASMGMDANALQQGMQMGAAPVATMTPGGEIFAMINSINIAEIAIFFVGFFIGGYMLYAAIFAAIGSAVDNAEDTSQFMMPITMLMVFALYAGIYSMDNPDGPLAFWCSMIPFTSPMVMMVRIPFDIPLWQTLLSLVILYASFIGLVWVSAKIYRVGILMYGKKPSFKEMAKWLKYK